MAGRPPVLVLGMHRSGTSLLTRMLDDLGLFLGRHRERNDEALLFLRLNEWILHQYGGRWDTPEVLRHLDADPELLRLAERYLRDALSSLQAASYLGPGRFLRHGTPLRLERPWGWKDPRTTVTLPVWLRIVPDARVVHLRRHGVDVAQSLRVRQRRDLADGARRYERRRHLHRLRRRPRPFLFVDSARCATLDGAFGLWEAYLRDADRHRDALGERFLDLRYEDLLADPEPTLARVADHAGLDAGADAIARAARRVERSRGLAYVGDAELERYAEGVRERLERYGYG